jgi:hypothetical protein
MLFLPKAYVSIRAREASGAAFCLAALNADLRHVDGEPCSGMSSSPASMKLAYLGSSVT